MINTKYNRLIIGGEDYTEYFTFPYRIYFNFKRNRMNHA